MALYDPQQHRTLVFLYGGEDPGVACGLLVAWTLWLLGYPDQARKRSYETLALAQYVAHPSTVTTALIGVSWVHQFRQDVQAAREQAEAVMALSTEQGFPEWLAWGTIVRGWALAKQGHVGEGIAQIHHGIAAHRATGAGLGRPHFLASLAEAYGQAGQTEEGLNVLVEALAEVDKSGQYLYEAELYRLKGQLTLQKFQVSGSTFQVSPNPQTEAEAYFHQAIEIARQQRAKSLELRAVMSLARLWMQQDKKDHVRQMLAEIYGWFTEGFDTVDLQEAKALLDVLTA